MRQSLPDRAVVFGALMAAVAAPGAAKAAEHEVAEFGPILTGCYEAAGDTDAKAACLGGMSSHCMDSQDGGHTTLGMTFCLGAEADVWDGFLNAEYRETRAWAEAADADEAVYFPEYAVRAEKLLDAQRAWIAFRDAECALDYAEWGAGSMRNIAYADCRLKMTAERTIELRRMREMFE